MNSDAASSDCKDDRLQTERSTFGYNTVAASQLTFPLTSYPSSQGAHCSTVGSPREVTDLAWNHHCQDGRHLHPLSRLISQNYTGPTSFFVGNFSS